MRARCARFDHQRTAVNATPRSSVTGRRISGGSKKRRGWSVSVLSLPIAIAVKLTSPGPSFSGSARRPLCSGLEA